YIQEVQRLSGLLSSSTEMVPASAELAASVQLEVGAFGHVGTMLAERMPNELYRQKLAFMLRRLQTSYAANGTPWRGPAGEMVQRDGPSYQTASELAADLALLRRSLESNRASRIAGQVLQDLIWQVQAFGFHLARLDLRQHRDR